MASRPPPPRQEDLQFRLEKLRARISAKRSEAKKLFSQLLKDLGIGISTEIPDTLREQLEQIRNALKLGTEKQEKKPHPTRQHNAVITTEEVLQAIESLTTPPGERSKLAATLLEEELKKVVAARYGASQVGTSPESWKTHAKAADYITMLDTKFTKQVAPFGGAEKLFDSAMELAEEVSERVLRQISKVSDEYVTTPAFARPQKEQLEL